MKKTFLAFVLNGALLGLIKLFYELVPPMSGLLYCTFLGFTITTAVGAKAAQTGAYLVSTVLGAAWAAGYVALEQLLLLTALPETASKALAFGLMSFIIEAANGLAFTKVKSTRYVPLQFAVIIAIFSQQCQHVPQVLAALVIGAAAALLSKHIYTMLLPSGVEK